MSSVKPPRDSLREAVAALSRSSTARGAFVTGLMWALKVVAVFGWALVLRGLAMPTRTEVEQMFKPTREAVDQLVTTKTADAQTDFETHRAMWREIASLKAQLLVSEDEREQRGSWAEEDFDFYVKNSTPQLASQWAVDHPRERKSANDLPAKRKYIHARQP